MSEKINTKKISVLIGSHDKGVNLETLDYEAIKKAIGGKFTAQMLDKKTAVFYDSEKQPDFLDLKTLAGTLALCGADEKKNPCSLRDWKLIKKHAKVFNKPPKQAEKTNTDQITL